MPGQVTQPASTKPSSMGLPRWRHTFSTATSRSPTSNTAIGCRRPAPATPGRRGCRPAHANRQVTGRPRAGAGRNVTTPARPGRPASAGAHALLGHRRDAVGALTTVDPRRSPGQVAHCLSLGHRPHVTDVADAISDHHSAIVAGRRDSRPASAMRSGRYSGPCQQALSGRAAPGARSR